MSNFERWQSRYDRGWVTKAQLQKLVSLEILTEQEYEDITGESYIS